MTTPLTRVLIVDDHVDIAEWSARELLLAGYHSHTAYEGERALELAQTFEPDVMILDIAMPGISGWEVARRVRKLDLTTRPRLIAVSAFNQDVHRERSGSVGFEHHLVKPIKLHELLTLLANPPPSTARTAIDP